MLIDHLGLQGEGPKTRCPICQMTVADSHSYPNRDVSRFSCKVCGDYEMTFRAMQVLGRPRPEKDDLFGLSAFVQISNNAGRIPEITSENWEQFHEAHAHASVSQKLRAVMEHARRSSPYAGAKVLMFDVADYARFSCRAAEVRFLLATLVKQRLLDEEGTDLYSLTAKGWEALEPSGAGGVPGLCFVAMSFDPELRAAYLEGIQTAVTDCGFEVVRLDDVEHSDNINDRILADIRRSQLVIADFTGHRGGVYFEAGFALGLGKVVIWTCREDEFKDKVHFDTRPYNHILWNDAADLRARLVNRMRALISNAKH